MRILIAPERFHPTMKARAVAEAMNRGLSKVSPQFEYVTYPLTSGGQGTTDLAVRLGGGRVYHETIAIANHRPRDVKWALLADGTAILDANDALGDPDGPPSLSKTYTTSEGLGTMLVHLFARNPKQVVIALSDVLAADGGRGVLDAFGIKGMSLGGQGIGPGAKQFLALERIDFSHMTPLPVPVVILFDVPVTWNERVHQEDFRLDLIRRGLEDACGHYADLLGEHIGMPLRDLSGTGVGGGLGLALAFLGAQFVSGASYLAELGGLGQQMWEVDWVLTGTTELTSSTVTQAVGVAAEKAREAGVPAVALATVLGPGHLDLYDRGLTGIYSVMDRPRPDRNAHRTLPALIEKAAFRVGYWMQAVSDP